MPSPNCKSPAQQAPPAPHSSPPRPILAPTPQAPMPPPELRAGPLHQAPTSPFRGILLWPFGWALGLLPLVSCSPAPAPTAGEPAAQEIALPPSLNPGSKGEDRDSAGIPHSAPISSEARAEIKAFVEAMIPPAIEETSDLHDEWLRQTRALRKMMEAREEEIGNAALHAFTGEVSDRTVTRQALLRIGTRCSPKAAAPLLRELMVTYGYRYDDRTEAAVLLAEADPEVYKQEAAAHLRRRKRATKTMPPDEFLIRAWVTACERTQTSPVDMLADAATNLVLDPPARYAAVEFLGGYPDDTLGREALKVCLVESTGDAYLRRKAAQAIRVSFNTEEACALFSHILSLEVDATFATFLADMQQLMGCK